MRTRSVSLFQSKKMSWFYRGKEVVAKDSTSELNEILA
jgi:hypothetical protein